ncbi:hypothetical protein [Nostoc sp. NMS8]|uniref:hypothetical protein n=1 Tax=Nostoc sp. NMS8 TaxID=2815392 RepID=UPI0025E9D412|nr:hypothetical protein [Nostoc sp. NMS8]MBN3959259.1 hypothetical protein [Nostoc sp. NMS8]
MQALTLQELFGDSAYQTATELVIKKSDLVAVGLTATGNNRAEQLVVAILLQVLSNFQGVLTDENGNQITDELNNSITYDNRNLWEFLEIFRWDDFLKERDHSVIKTSTFVIHSYDVQTD